MSFQNRNPPHTDNRLPFQGNTMHHSQNNRFPAQHGNRFPSHDCDQFGFPPPDERPPFIDEKLPLHDNKPFRNGQNNLQNKKEQTLNDRKRTCDGNNHQSNRFPPPCNNNRLFQNNPTSSSTRSFQNNLRMPPTSGNTNMQFLQRPLPPSLPLPPPSVTLPPADSLGKGKPNLPGNVNLPFQGNSRLHFQNNLRLPFQGNSRLPFQGNSRLPFQDNPRLPFQDNSGLPFQDNTRLPFQDNPRLPFPDNPRLRFQQDHGKLPPRLPFQMNAQLLSQVANNSNISSPFPNVLPPLLPGAPVQPDTNHLMKAIDGNCTPVGGSRTLQAACFPPANLNPIRHLVPVNTPLFVPGKQPPFVPVAVQVALLGAPPLDVASSCESVSDMKEEYREIMVDISKQWTESRNFTTAKMKDGQFLKLHKYRENLKVFVRLIDKLRHLNDSLAEHMEAEKSVWDKLMEDVTKTKNEVVTLQFTLFNPDQMQFINDQQRNRKKKRERVRRKKKKQSEEYVTSLSKRIKLNEELDELQHKQRTKIAMEKMVETLKNEAGESLVEVKRKQSEITELADVFKLLKQLRDIRKETAIYKGIFVTEKDDANFAMKIDEASELLCHQKKVYEGEERALRVLREEEAEEMDRLEKEKRKKMKQNCQDQLSTMDPMFPFRLYWLQGEESGLGLVHVRRLWDIFLCPFDTPDGQRIPKSFIEPCEPSNKEWARFLVKQPKVRKRKSDFGVSSKM